jgi:hypothetical protein
MEIAGPLSRLLDDWIADFIKDVLPGMLLTLR